MRSWIDYIKDILTTFRSETLVSVTTILSLVVGLVSIYLDLADTYLILIVMFNIIIIGVLFAILLNLKRYFKLRFSQIDEMFQTYRTRLETVDQILLDFFGVSWHENQYFTRLRHFVKEKQLLGRVVVLQVLPDVIDKICRENPNLKQINIILDSGTTITPMFPLLVRNGVKRRNEIPLNLFTNNLAGIDEIHRMDRSEQTALTERDFNLIGGRPLNKYRATTGKLTLTALSEIWPSQKDVIGETINIGVITANWIIAGISLDRLQICARGEGHFEFKKSIIENCQHLIVVVPLGKILRLHRLEALNERITDKYESYTLPEDKRNQTLLVTTFRPVNSVSPLLSISNDLQLLIQEDATKNYIFYDKTEVFEPSPDKSEAERIEMPHSYMKIPHHKFVGVARSDSGWED